MEAFDIVMVNQKVSYPNKPSNFLGFARFCSYVGCRSAQLLNEWWDTRDKNCYFKNVIEMPKSRGVNDL